MITLTKVARLAPAALGIAFLACGGEGEPTADLSRDSFCEAAQTAVQAWLDEARRVHGQALAAPFGGTAVVGSLGEIADGMMVAATADYVANQHQQFVNLMTLIEYDADLRPRPYLAEAWEVSEDGTALTFRLRDDVLWHDGEVTDAHDVAFTYLRLTDPATGYPNAAFWDRYVPGEAGVEVVDDHTVRFRLEPHADFLDPWRTVAILPEHLLGDVPPGELKGHPYGTRCPVGNGPFVFREHVDQERWRFEANPAFPADLGGRPPLDAYVYRVIPDENTLLLELLSGGVDVLISATPDQVEAMEAAPTVELRSYPFRNFTFIAWNSRRPQLADPRVRRALTMGVDREAVVAGLLDGYGSVAHGTVPPWHWAHDPEVGVLPYDPTAARALLAEAGWVDRDGDGIREDGTGAPLSIGVKSNQGNRRLQRLVLVLQDQLADIGVEVRPELLEWAALVGQITDPENRDFDGVVLSWVTEFKLDDTDLFRSDRADQAYGFSGIQDEVLDRYLERLPDLTDRGEAREAWRSYQARLSLLQPFTFFYFPDRLDGVSTRLENVVMDARGEWVNLREWRLADGG